MKKITLVKHYKSIVALEVLKNRKKLGHIGLKKVNQRTQQEQEAELQEVAAHARSFAHQPDRMAIVAEDAVSFEAARVHRLFRQSPGAEERVFRTVDEAMAWLKE